MKTLLGGGGGGVRRHAGLTRGRGPGHVAQAKTTGAGVAFSFLKLIPRGKEKNRLGLLTQGLGPEGPEPALASLGATCSEHCDEGDSLSR